MIRLHRLQANGFKQLRDVDLTFPEHCTVLIEGENEAGKSTLLEAVCFALYGKSITATNNDNLISNRLTEAVIQLDFSVDGVNLSVMRNLRHKRSQAQLRILQTDGSSEELHHIKRINEEIISYLHGLDAEALRNSCLVEQKGLGRLDDLSLAKRQEILLKLLDQDRLVKVRKHFEHKKPDERLLQRVAKTVRLARAWRELEQVKILREMVERKLLLIDLKVTLDALQSHLNGEQEFSTNAREHTRKAEELAEQIATVEQWSEVIARIRELRTARRSLVEVKRQRDENKRTLEELHVLEQEQLPALQNKLQILNQADNALELHTALNSRITEETDQVKRLEEILDLESKIIPLRTTVGAYKGELTGLQEEAQGWINRLKEAKESAALLAKSEALHAWAGAHRRTKVDWEALEASIGALRQKIGHLQSLKETLSATVQTSMARRRWAYLSISASGLMILIGILLSLGRLADDPSSSSLVLAVALWGLGAGLATPGVVFLIRVNRRIMSSYTEMRRYEQECHSLETELAKHEGRSDALDKQSQGLLAAPKERLTNLGLAEPETADLADQLAAEYAARVDNMPDLEMIERKVQDTEKAAREFETTHAPESGELRVLEADLQSRTDKEGLDSTSSAREMAAHIQLELKQLTKASEEAWATAMRLATEWLGDTSPEDAASRLNQVRGQSKSEITACEKRLGERSTLEENLRELEKSLLGEVTSVRSLETKFDAEATQDSIFNLPAAGEEDKIEEQLSLRVAQADLPSLKGEQQSQRDLASRADQVASRSNQDAESSRTKANQLLAKLRVDDVPIIDPETVRLAIPELTEIDTEDRDHLTKKREETIGHQEKFREECENLSTELGISPDSIDETAEVSRLNELAKKQRICQLAETVIVRTRTNLLNRLLPDTLEHARLFLPFLTDGRYFDAELDETSFRLKVWDAQFGRMVERELFSGGAQDQFALALRLGFAIATLPQELGAAPSFIFLDEPVASFDRTRREAFVKLVCEGEIGQRFSQIFIAEPEGIFPENPFPHYIRMKAGRVDKINLG